MECKGALGAVPHLNTCRPRSQTATPRSLTDRCDLSVRVVLSFFFQAEDGIRDYKVTGVQTCALPISIAGNLVRLRCADGRPDLPRAASVRTLHRSRERDRRTALDRRLLGCRTRGKCADRKSVV